MAKEGEAPAETVPTFDNITKEDLAQWTKNLEKNFSTVSQELAELKSKAPPSDPLLMDLQKTLVQIQEDQATLRAMIESEAQAEASERQGERPGEPTRTKRRSRSNGEDANRVQRQPPRQVKDWF